MRSKEPSIAKITRPGAQGIFPRKRLFRLLDRGLGFPITWVTGPPGSGKTALVTSYLDARKLPCLWYQIDERDADIASFFYYMGLATTKIYPQKRKQMPLLTPEYSTGIPAFARGYFEELYSRLSPPILSGRNPSISPLRKGHASPPRFIKDNLPIPTFNKANPSISPFSKGGKGRFVIVFDDYQNVPVNSGFHDMIVHGLDVIPEIVNVFILSRNEPPPQLVRLRANGKMNFLGWDEIRFTLEESREIVRTKGQGRIKKETLLQLHEETEGWAAGLVLILLGSRIGKTDYQLMSRFPTKEIYDYFAAEIFEKVEKKTQQFLVITAVLPRMTAQAAEKLTGIGNSNQLLSNLSENHYFTEKYSHDNPVYQYHPLFRDFLLSRMEDLFSPDEIMAIRQKAALILEESGRVEEAAALFRDAGDWKGLSRLISSQAQALIRQGRHKTLEEWIRSIPEDIQEKEPWLLSWLGICKQPFSPAESRALFEQAVRLFEKQRNGTGTLLAWSALVDTIVVEWNDFTLLDPWIEWMDKRLKEGLPFPSPETEARVASSMAGALLYRQPYHPDIRKWIERSLSLCRETESINLRLHTYLYAVNYYAWTGDLPRCDMVTREIRKMAQSAMASPLLVLTWKWIEALIYNRTAASSEAALKSISEGLEIAQKNGVHVWDQMLLSQGVYASLNRRDMEMAGGYLSKMETTLEENRRHSEYQFHYLAAWYHLLTESIPRSFLHAETASRLADKTGMYFDRILCSLLMAQVLHEKGEHKKAASRLSSARELVIRLGSPMLEYMCLIKEAQFAMDYGEAEKQGMEALRKAMDLGRKQGYLNLFPWWQPSVMARLCAKALAEGIETAYVRDLIRIHNLFPDELPVDIENWPWPLKIHALGRFELLKDGKPLQFSGKVQKKPLLMLKALIAHGGKSVREEMLADSLWPDADGDQAHSAFTTTLSRLRQLIGNEKAIEVLEGKVTLNPRYLWVDAWAFERIFDKAEGLWKGGPEEDAAEEAQLADRAMELYGGHFLPADEEHPWSVSLRERLRSKFLHLITRLGDHLQKMGRLEKAMEYYQKALKIDELSEEIYQLLMVCFQKLGRPSEAISVYRRCQKVLSSNFGIEPSPKTTSIYKNLLVNQRS